MFKNFISTNIILFLLLSCATTSKSGPIKLKASLQKPVKTFLITNPVITGKKKTIRSLQKRITVSSINKQIQIAYSPVKTRLPTLLKKSGAKTSNTNNSYEYSDLFNKYHKPIASKLKTLIYDADKILVIPVINIIEKKEDVNINSKTMCPGQYHSKMKLSLRFVDSRGKLLLDSSEIKRKNASVEQALHGLLIMKKKCGMLYKPKQNFKKQFKNISVSYVNEVFK